MQNANTTTPFFAEEINLDIIVADIKSAFILPQLTVEMENGELIETSAHQAYPTEGHILYMENGSKEGDDAKYFMLNPHTGAICKAPSIEAIRLRYADKDVMVAPGCNDILAANA